MLLARKIILHGGVSDEPLLAGFVQQSRAQRVSLLAISGPGAAELEKRRGFIVVGDGSDPSRFLCTSSRRDELYVEVLDMAQKWNWDGIPRAQRFRTRGAPVGRV